MSESSSPVTFSLQGRTALVTGSTKGIGGAMADALQAHGARVLRHGRTPGNIACATYLLADLSQPDGPRALMDAAIEAAPDFNILVCNAGSFFDTPFLEMTPEAWDKTMGLNVRAPYFLIQAFARHLVSQKRPGSVVIVGSTNGIQAELDSSAYDTSKGALATMTRTLSLALAQYNIRVNLIAPGLIKTPLTGWLDQQHEVRAHYEKNIPLHRIGNSEDCAGAAVFLSSDAAAYITGQTIIVDGGLTVPQIGPL